MQTVSDGLQGSSLGLTSPVPEIGGSAAAGAAAAGFDVPGLSCPVPAAAASTTTLQVRTASGADAGPYM